MGNDVAIEFLKLLEKLEPGWALLFLMTVILGVRAPELIKQLFAGIRVVILATRQTPRKRSAHGRAAHENHELSLSSNSEEQTSSRAA